MGKLLWTNNQQYLLQKNVEQVVPFLRHFSPEQVNRVVNFSVHMRNLKVRHYDA